MSEPSTPWPPAASGWARWLPGLQLLRHYPASWWRHDIAAGLVLTTMLVPVGIAYAVASGLPGIHGLYATIAALLAYALFGPSRILVLGPDSALAALILAVLLPLAAGDPARAVALAGQRLQADEVALRVVGRNSGLLHRGGSFLGRVGQVQQHRLERRPGIRAEQARRGESG